jgi:hypothetical protein
MVMARTAGSVTGRCVHRQHMPREGVIGALVGDVADRDEGQPNRGAQGEHRDHNGKSTDSAEKTCHITAG